MNQFKMNRNPLQQTNINCLQKRYLQMYWFNNLCNCFSPQLRRNIIGYLSSSNLNRQVIQQEKCTQKIEDKDEQSIYDQIKQRSYYTIHGDDNEHIQKQLHQEDKNDNQIQFQNQLDPCWYPQKGFTNDQIFIHKLKALKAIFQQQIDQQYQKVYDSQDENHLLIYAKNQLQKGKRNSIYRFLFNVPNSDEPTQPKDFLQLNTIDQEGKSLIESLLKNRQVIQTSPQNLQICYRTYDKKLVISQHDFVTAQKSILQEELDQQLSTQGKQIYNDIVYTVSFSVKGVKDQKSVVYNRGHVNLCGLKVSLQTKEKKNEENQGQIIYYRQLQIEGYINLQLDTTVNSNMLKQPVAKQIRTYAQKLICLLQKSDAI